MLRDLNHLPPMRSGMSMPRRSISLATCTISVREGVMRPDRPTMSAPSATHVFRIVSAGTFDYSDTQPPTYVFAI